MGIVCVRVRARTHMPTHDKTGHENKESDLTCGNAVGGVSFYLLGVYEVRNVSEGSVGAERLPGDSMLAFSGKAAGVSTNRGPFSQNLHTYNQKRQWQAAVAKTLPSLEGCLT